MCNRSVRANPLGRLGKSILGKSIHEKGREALSRYELALVKSSWRLLVERLLTATVDEGRLGPRVLFSREDGVVRVHWGRDAVSGHN